MDAQFTIRDATVEDYPAIAAILRVAEPANVTSLSADGILQMDRSLAGRSRARRRVVETNGTVVATSRFLIPPHMFHLQKFQFYTCVHPDFQRQGIGRALYDDMISLLASENPISMRSIYREDMPHSERFLTGLGFAEEHRIWESWLDVNGFDAAPFESARRRARDAGIEIRTLADVKADPDWQHKLHALIIHIQSDMPQPEPYVPWPFEEYIRVELNRPSMVPESYFIAVDGDAFVGVSILHKDAANPKRLNTDDTGTRRDYRRNGIATLLKVHGIEYARAHGYERIYTMNSSTNQPMLTLNTRLGFQRQPAWVGVIRHF